MTRAIPIPSIDWLIKDWMLLVFIMRVVDADHGAVVQQRAPLCNSSACSRLKTLYIGLSCQNIAPSDLLTEQHDGMAGGPSKCCQLF